MQKLAARYLGPNNSWKLEVVPQKGTAVPVAAR
jgi:hypothetical protein